MAAGKEVTRIDSIEALGEVSPRYVYVGSDVFEPTMVMPDHGRVVEVDGWDITLYRGPKAPQDARLRVYGFSRDTVSPGTVRRIKLMARLGGAMAPFGAGPNRPYPFLDQHPYYQLRPVTADILFQFDNRSAEWNQAKGLTEAGSTWLQERADPAGYILQDPDAAVGTVRLFAPSLYMVVSNRAVYDRLEVWEAYL